MNVNLKKSESGCKFGNKWSFPHRKVEEQPNKKPKKGGDKNAVATAKDVRQLGRVLQDTAIFIHITEGHKSLGTSSTSTIHKSYAASCKHRRK